jgi:preprotein translocase subunit SecF
MYKIIQSKKIWLSISGLLVGLSVLAWIVWGLNFGIDFTGGSLLEVRFLGEKPTVDEVKTAMSDLDLGSLTVQPVGKDSMILRFQDTSEEKHQEILERLGGLKKDEQRLEQQKSELDSGNIKIKNIESKGNVEVEVQPVGIQNSESQNIEELRFDSVGPSIGEELKRKSVHAIIWVLIAIVLYIAWAFRKVSKPVASWKYGLVAIAALFHDVLITVGAFVVLGKFFGVEVNTPFVVAILTVLGYSVNDTIVVFDRIRENLPRSEEDFESTVNTSVNQTITRSVNTSLTTLLVLLSIVFFGGSTIRSFALALSIGIFIGTYSSIFLASPLLVVWERFRK